MTKIVIFREIQLRNVLRVVRWAPRFLTCCKRLYFFSRNIRIIMIKTDKRCSLTGKQFVVVTSSMPRAYFTISFRVSDDMSSDDLLWFKAQQLSFIKHDFSVCKSWQRSDVEFIWTFSNLGGDVWRQFSGIQLISNTIITNERLIVRCLRVECHYHCLYFVKC